MTKRVFRTRTRRTLGIHPSAVVIEATPTGAGSIVIDGLSEVAARETSLRVASALRSVSIHEHHARVRVECSSPGPTPEPFDLAIAIAIAGAHGKLAIDAETPELFGELGFDGQLRPVRGLFAMLGPLAWSKRVYREPKVRNYEAIVPIGQIREAKLGQIRVIGATHLETVLGMLRARPLFDVGVWEAPQKIPPPKPPEGGAWYGAESEMGEAARSGSVLLVGPPGSGKMLISRSLARLAPLPSDRAFRDMLAVWSVAGLLADGSNGIVPFRAPHHTVSTIGLVGGGAIPRPGEVSLAHGGVLVLDEFPEFRPDAIDALRVALRDGEVRLARSGASVWFPGKPALVIGTATPCPCGYVGQARCRCSAQMIGRHQKRLERLPWARRIDLPREVCRGMAPTRLGLSEQEREKQ